MKRKTIWQKWIAALLAAAMTLSLAACGSSETTEADSGETEETAEAATEEAADTGEADDGEESTVTIGIQSAWGNLCPYFDTGNYTDIVVEQIYDKLFVNLDDGTVEPRLATGYDIDEDGTSATVYLDETAAFTDGVGVTADDVVYTTKLLSDSDFNSVVRPSFLSGTNDSGILNDGEELGIEKVDDYTVRFTFKTPMSETFILSYLSTIDIVPEHIYGAYTSEELNDGSIWDDNMIGSGPYILDSVIDGVQIEYVKNENYHLGAPQIDRLVIKVVTQAQMLTSLMAGEIDVVGGIVGELLYQDWVTASSTEGLVTESYENYSYQAMIVNVTSEKIPNAECRYALGVAINKQSIVDNLLGGEGEALYAPFRSKHPYVDLDALEYDTYDPELARQILEENGFDFDTTLELIVPTGNEVRINSSVLIQQDLANIGVNAEITQYDFATLMQKMNEGDFDLGLCGAVGTAEPSNAFAWITIDSSVNFANVQDRTYDDWHDAASQISDQEEQYAEYTKIWQYLIEDSPLIFLYSPNSLVCYNERVSGVDPGKICRLNWCTWEWTVSD